MASRTQVETLLVKRCGGYMSKASMAVTYVGSNADLDDPMGWALRQLDYSVADPTTVTTAEVAEVSTDDFDQFLDLAELRTLENVYGQLAVNDASVGPRSENLSQLARQVAQRMQRLENRLETLYGFGIAALEMGVIEDNFVQHNDLPEASDE